MTPHEQRTFLTAVMVVAEPAEAELAARTLHALNDAEARQGELFALLNSQKTAAAA
jgi:hypothetical protein